MVMGRPNKGVDHVDSCEGSAQSKRRAKAVLQTITGEKSVIEAMQDVKVQRPYFATMRSRALQGLVDALEPGRPGRKPKRDAETEQQVAKLTQRIAELERELQLERARAELAPLLPKGRKDGQKGGATSRQERRKRERELRKKTRR